MDNIKALNTLFSSKRADMIKRLSKAYMYKEFGHLDENITDNERNAVICDLFVIENNNQILYGVDGFLDKYYKDIEEVKNFLKAGFTSDTDTSFRFHKLIMNSNRAILLSGISLYTNFMKIILRVCSSSLNNTVAFKNYIEGVRRKMTTDLETLRILRLRGNQTEEFASDIVIHGAEAVRHLMYNMLTELKDMKCLEKEKDGVKIPMLKDLMEEFITEYKTLSSLELNVDNPMVKNWNQNKMVLMHQVGDVMELIKEGRIEDTVYQYTII